ncbi:MAG: phospholipase [Muribaculaceae bacterium]|nr:phospholipase [Muribaculaceae bacterium]MDE7155596.1 phospholipase [Muribaculaceae bacterium]MDE7369703.1 phospholipase [Muribaculaceae bacterium]
MIVSLIILASLIAVGLPLYLSHRRYQARVKDGFEPEPQVNDEAEEQCCGLHITCEKDSLLASVSKEIEYYDDEELDRFAGRRPDEYSDAEIDQFRDVLLTLLPQDIAGWARSIQQRNIELPSPVRDELLMIVSEARAAR